MNRSNLNASTKSRVLLRINTIITKLTMKDAKKLTVYFSICWLNICYFQSRIIQLILDNYSGRSGLAPFKSICDYRNIQKDWLPAQKKEKNHLSGSKEKVRPDNNYERVRRVYDIEIVLTTLLTENSFLKSSCCWIIPSTTKPVKKEMMESKLL